MAKLPLFKHRKPYMNIVAPNTTVVRFVNHMYYTDDEDVIEFLQGCVKNRRSGVYIDDKQPEVDTDAMSPHDMLKAKIIREYEDEKVKAARANAAASTNPGDSVQGSPSQSVANTTHTATPQVTPPQAAPTTSGAKVVEPPKELEQAKAGATATKK